MGQSSVVETKFSSSILDLLEVDRLCDRYEELCRKGSPPDLDQFLDDVPTHIRGKLHPELRELVQELNRFQGRRPRSAQGMSSGTYQPVGETGSMFPEPFDEPLSGSQSEDYDPIADSESHIRPATGSHDTSPFPPCGPMTVSSAGPRTGFSSRDSSLHQYVGRTIGRYEILGCLGRGGMGVVYRALDRDNDRIVALKTIPPDRFAAANDDSENESIARFLREIRAHSELEHEHIVRFYEHGTEGDAPYYVTRFMEGGDLDRRIGDQPIDPDQAARWMRQVASAVHFGHRKGIIHRDIKPRNILLDERDRAYVIDFGLTKRLGVDRTMTHTGLFVGTLRYASPEQARVGRDVGVSSDVYSLGATLYHLLTGRPPFSHENDAKLKDAILRDLPIPPSKLNSNVPPALERICLKCLRKNRWDRYGGADELQADLERFLAGKPVRARKPTGSEWASDLIRRRIRETLVLLGMVTALIGAALTTWWFDAHLRVEQVLVSDWSEFRGRADRLWGYRFVIEGPLHQAYEARDSDRSRAIRAAAVLVERDPEPVEFLARSVLKMDDPAGVQAIRRGLAYHPSRTARILGPVLADRSRSDSERLRAAAVLAATAPALPAWENPKHRWLKALIGESPSRLAIWTTMLRPVAAKLVPTLHAGFLDKEDPSLRQSATDLLAEFLSRRPGDEMGLSLDRFTILTELLTEADPSQIQPLVRSLASHGPDSAERLDRLVESFIAPPDEDALGVEACLAVGFAAVLAAESPRWNETRREVWAQVRSRLSLARLTLDESTIWPWSTLEQRRDPRARTAMLHGINGAGISRETIRARLEVEGDPIVRAALILALGMAHEGQPESETGDRIVARLLDLARKDPHPGVHSATNWTLRQWGHHEKVRAIEDEARSVDPRLGFDWYVNLSGMPFAVIRGPVEFRCEQPSIEPVAIKEDGLSHTIRARIPHSFAIATREVIAEDVEKFYRELARTPTSSNAVAGNRPAPGMPVKRAGRALAARFCNWMSQREGLPEDQWCYPDLDFLPDRDICLHPDFLRRTGYRPATEQEWEYAARAGTTTERHFGQNTQYLGYYAWIDPNLDPIYLMPGKQLPNSWGLFDMLGNVGEVVIGWHNENFFIRRGSPASVAPKWHRSANRMFAERSIELDGTGLRLARTIVPEPNASIP